MRFGILGPVEIHRTGGDHPVLNRPRVRAVLTLLALEAGRTVSTDALLEGVYGDAVPTRAINALQAQISRLRKQLGTAAGLVRFDGTGYRLAVSPDAVDAHRFESLSGQGRRTLRAGEYERALPLLDEALALWRGQPLTDLADTPTTRGRAATLQHLWLDTAEALIETKLALGRADDVLTRLRELIADYPLRERLRAQLVRALTASGRPSEALTAFDQARRVLVEELGADPSAELAEAHAAALRTNTIPIAAHAGVTVPTALTSFIGMRNELARLAALLRSERLVTLTGAGGAGKTRLAVEAVGRETQTTYFVELSTVSVGADVPQAVSTALGLRDTGGPTEHADRLCTALAKHSTLLVVDNCEQVVDAVAELLVSLLSACPGLRVLATSREPLGITGEALFPVTGLPAAPPGTAVEAASDFPAVRLFTDRAALSNPAFDLDEDTVDDVVRICHALDGLPLAIELAAARVRALPVAEVAALLDDRFALLGRGERTRPARHRTLHAVVEWSWALLTPEERTLAGRLSVFAGGIGLSAVKAVFGDGSVDSLTALVDKSLVEVRDDGRYRMLETVRAFAADRLAENGDAAHWHRAHAEHFLTMAEAADPHLRGAGQLDWLSRLDPEADNLHTALRWATRDDPALALRLISALSMYWWLRGRRSEGGGFARAALDRLDAHPPAGLAEEYLLSVFTAVSTTSEHRELEPHLRAAHTLAAHWTKPPRQPLLTVLWARLAGPGPIGGTALPSPPVALLAQDPWNRALHPLSDGMRQLHGGEPAAAERSFAAALTRFRRLGERWGLIKSLSALGRLASRRGDDENAHSTLTEAIELSEQLGATEETVELLCERAEYRARTGDVAAGADADRAFTLATSTGEASLLARSRAARADVVRTNGDLLAARSLAEHALAECPATWPRPSETRSRVLLVLARIAIAQGQRDDALEHLRRIVATGDRLAAAAAKRLLRGPGERGPDPDEAPTTHG